MKATIRLWRYLITPLVFAGMLSIGCAAELDPAAANTTPMTAGSFVTHFGKQVHWDGARDEVAALLIMGEGPATSTGAESK